jgi:hypothetical protein
VSRDTQTEDDVKTEDEEASPTERRVMRVVLWGIVAVMAVAWIFLFYNVASRTLFAAPTPVPAAKPAPPAKPEAAKPEPAKPEAAKPAPAQPAVPIPPQPPPIGSPVPGSTPSMVIDEPLANATVTQPFTVRGWAIDTSAAQGTGVDAVAVWATPAAGGESKLLGPAQYGSERGDIAATFGPRFLNSGYTLSASGLTAGTWRISVYIHSTVTKEFSSALTVTVTVP